MRVWVLGFAALFVFAMAPSGCAAVIGLDSGDPLPGDGGSSDGGSGEGGSDSATPTDSGGAPVCSAGTADCNGLPQDGCETMLNTNDHCGGCTTKCLPGRSCQNDACCSNMNQLCGSDAECCSGNCHNNKCDKPGGGG